MESEEKVRNKVKRKLRIDEKRLINSFAYAFEGIKQAYLGEQNLRIHTFIAILVIMAEFINTAIEYVVDLASPKIHPLAKAAKDTASAGVLMMAIISATIGLVIFVPKLIDFIGGLL